LWEQAFFLVVYDRRAGTVVGFFDSKADVLPALYLQHLPHFHAACMGATPWARFITPFPGSVTHRELGGDHSQPWSQYEVRASLRSPPHPAVPQHFNPHACINGTRR
jgi:hypothetical protein